MSKISVQAPFSVYRQTDDTLPLYHKQTMIFDWNLTIYIISIAAEVSCGMQVQGYLLYVLIHFSPDLSAKFSTSGPRLG